MTALSSDCLLIIQMYIIINMSDNYYCTCHADNTYDNVILYIDNGGILHPSYTLTPHGHPYSATHMSRYSLVSTTHYSVLTHDYSYDFSYIQS